MPLALNSTTQVPPSRCRGCRVHSRNEGLAGHRAVCERQATPAALSVATIESAALPENTTSDGLHAGLRPGGAREKPVYSIAGTHTPVHLSCAQHGPCRCHPRPVEISVGLDIIPSAFPHVGYVCSKLSLRCPSWWRLVRLMLDAAWEACFLFSFLSSPLLPLSRIRCDFRGPVQLENVKLMKVTAAVVLLEMPIDGFCWAAWDYLMRQPSLREMWLW